MGSFVFDRVRESTPEPLQDSRDAVSANLLYTYCISRRNFFDGKQLRV